MALSPVFAGTAQGMSKNVGAQPARYLLPVTFPTHNCLLARALRYVDASRRAFMALAYKLRPARRNLERPPPVVLISWNLF
jgi:hypothetical protein